MPLYHSCGGKAILCAEKTERKIPGLVDIFRHIRYNEIGFSVPEEKAAQWFAMCLQKGEKL